MGPRIAAPGTAIFPLLTREGVTWRSVTPGRVEIAVDLRNDADRPTSPGELVIEAAGLGAFVPFTPVTRIAVGALEPGGRRRVRTAVARAFLPGQGSFLPAMADALRTTGLSTEFVELVSRSEWAGNVNVYFDRRPERAVEVHRALGLKVRAGHPVAVMVDLPHDRNAYRVEARVSDPAWTSRLAAFQGSFYFLVVTPPPVAGARAGVTVEATRLRDSRTVPVEFAFETVDGRGESLGCLRL